MNWFVYFLLFSCLILPAVAVTRCCITKRGIEIDHIFLFSCGFVLYLIAPFAMGITNYYTIYRDFGEVWYSTFSKITNNTWAAYLSCCLAFYLSFISGSLFSKKIRINEARLRFSFDKRGLYFFLLIAIVAGIYFAYPLRDKFFTFYSIQPIFQETGSLNAATIFLLSLAFIYSTKTLEESKNTVKFRRIISNWFFVIYIIFAELLISLGTRVVVISSLLMLLVFYSVYLKPLKTRNLVFSFLAIIILSHIVESFRYRPSGSIPPDLFFINTIFFKTMGDSFNTSDSLMHFLNDYSFSLIRFPVTLLTGLITLIPSFILPSKNTFMVHFYDIGYNIINPKGCTSVFVSLMINFGIIGTILFLFLLSYFLNFLKKRTGQPWPTMYIMTSGWLAIMFFRDLEQAILKEILEFSILVPVFIAIILSKVSNKCSQKNDRAVPM